MTLIDSVFSTISCMATISCADCATSYDRYHYCGRDWCSCPICKPKEARP